MCALDIKALTGQAEAQRQTWDVPALMLGIWQNGEALFSGGFGLRDGNRLPADGETLFQIGSCTKAFTAAAAEILAERGLLDLDMPIVQYLPEFDLMDRYAAAHVTARDLLCHRSGLPRHEYAWYGTDFTREQLVYNLRYLEPNLELRSSYQYNNLGFVAVGYLLERLTGKTWEELIRQELLEPLGMTRTAMFLDEALADPNHALPFDRPVLYGASGCKAIPFHRTAVEDRAKGIGAPFGPAGSIFSCVEDMLRWAAFQLGDGAAGGRQLLCRERLEEMHRPQMIVGAGSAAYPGRGTCFYGLGWQSCIYRGIKVLHHSGGIDGFTTAFYLAPSLHLAVVANVNMNTCFLAEAAACAVLDQALGVSGDSYGWYRQYNQDMFQSLRDYAAAQRGTPVSGTAPSHPEADFTGRYRAAGYNDLVISRDGEGLVLDFNGFHSPLSHFHYDIYQLEGYIGELPPGLTLQFFYDTTGAVSRLEIPLVADPGVKPICFRKV